jgi:NAD(P)-dependent dehydrogenase (short-subunit alcohol dehydrogenase family)
MAHLDRLVDSTLDHFNSIDLLVNNAGIGPRERMDMLIVNEKSYDEVMAVNLKGAFFLTQRVANEMISLIEAGKIQNPKIVNIGSISAYTSSPNRAEYCISKAGMAMTTALWADRLAEYGINVYEIRPGIIETDLTSVVKDKYDQLILEDGITPIRRWGQPADIGKAVVAIAEGYLPYSTGEVINVDGGFHLSRL